MSARSVVQRHPVAAYLGLTSAISWTGALLVVLPYLVRREPVPKMSGLLMFPVMLLGPSCAGIILTWLVQGARGLQHLFWRMCHVAVPARWYAVLLFPPGAVLSVLFCLKAFVSTRFAPNVFPV